jgi:osmotically-inducible protein OsmY
MMSSFDLFAIVMGIAAIAGVFVKLSRRGQTGVVAAMLATVLMTAFASPVMAAAANDNALSNDQQALQETLKTTPHNNQYQGIEYAQTTGESLSDREIMRRVKKEIPDNVKLSVSSGSVRLSGQVNSRDVAQRIIQDIKTMPGVHEISYDLGLNS